MNLLAKLLGPRVAVNAKTIAAEIEARRDALANTRATLAAATQARADAVDALDTGAMARAEVEAADASRVVEVGAKALEVLTSAHAARVDAERKTAADALKHALDERMTALKARRAEWAAAAATIATMIAEAGALARDRVEAGLSETVEVSRGLPLHESVASVDRLFDGWLSQPLSVPESVAERQVREARERSDRRRAEREAESARKAEERADAFKAQRLAERDEQDARERNRYLPVPWRDNLDAAR